MLLSGYQSGCAAMVQAHVRQLPSIESPLSERRSFARRKARLDAILTVHGRFQRILIHNISRSGMKLKNAFGLVPGDVVTVELLFDRTLEGTVMWVGGAVHRRQLRRVARRRRSAAGEPVSAPPFRIFRHSSTKRLTAIPSNQTFAGSFRCSPRVPLDR
jgi:PilZ domain